MKPFKLSKSSLHYRLANTYGNHYKHDDEPDLCRYIRNVIKGAMVVMLICTIGAGVVGGITGSFLAWLMFITMNGFIKPDELAFAGIIIFAFIFLLGCLFFNVETDSGKTIRRNVRQTVNAITGSVPKVKEDSFVKLAYRRFKDKTCVRLTLD